VIGPDETAIERAFGIFEDADACGELDDFETSPNDSLPKPMTQEEAA
jgi:hypothetical protein